MGNVLSSGAEISRDFVPMWAGGSQFSWVLWICEGIPGSAAP